MTIDISVLLNLLPIPIIDVFPWLMGFINADDSVHIKVMFAWVCLIVAVHWLADYVTRPKLTTLEIPQEYMDAKGKHQTKMVEVTYVNFEITKMSQISSRKLFHFLMVLILGPVVVKGGPHVQSFCALALGGLGCLCSPGNGPVVGIPLDSKNTPEVAARHDLLL